ncbi:MAG: CDP-alcohol phosphatidyltransferase family protein [Actinobacteria bacterium]|nr:CDP-alcohol phosphatidyltransferase family protein [Actinomycetota bacterium]
MLDGRWRTNLEQGVKPAGAALARTGLRADHLTVAGLVMATATAVAVASGRLLLGVVLLALAGIPDLLDGAVAKATGTASSRGAFFDSVADRVTDCLVLGGIGWHLAVSRGGLAPMLPFAVMGASTLISYERARAESLGYSARGGLMERAERLVLIGFGLAFPALLLGVLWLMLLATVLTALQRFVMVWRQASVPRPARRQRPMMGERWRAWREQTATRPSIAEWRSATGRRPNRDRHRRPSPAWRRR